LEHVLLNDEVAKSLGYLVAAEITIDQVSNILIQSSYIAAHGGRAPHLAVVNASIAPEIKQNNNNKERQSIS
jgi:hypothetical protein